MPNCLFILRLRFDAYETFTQINIQDPDLITFTINGIDITCDRSDVCVFLEAVK